MFRGICYAIQAIHQHQLPKVPTTREGEQRPPVSMRLSSRDNNNTLTDEETLMSSDEGLDLLDDQNAFDSYVAFAHRDVKPG